MKTKKYKYEPANSFEQDILGKPPVTKTLDGVGYADPQSIAKVELIAYTPEPERVIASAAKLCYSRHDPQDIYNSLSDEGDVEKFLGKLSDYGHMSPVEHANFTFMVSGVSRALLAQITRHRLASFSVQSQRYNDMDNFTPIIPQSIGGSMRANIMYHKAMETDSRLYNKIRYQILLEKVVMYLRDNISYIVSDMDRSDTAHYDSESKAIIFDWTKNGETSTIKIWPDQFINAIVKWVNEEECRANSAVFPVYDIEMNMEGYKYVDSLYSFGTQEQCEILRDCFKNDMLFKRFYNKAEKEANEDARMVLPNACTTNFVFTMNARELLHFFDLRCCNRAQWEIRWLAWACLEEVSKVAPTIFQYAGPGCVRGKCSEGSMTCGHPYKAHTQTEE